MVAAPRRQFTVDDYARMRETGILTEDDRVELIDGEIFVMSPMGSRHVALLNRLNKLLIHMVADAAVVSPQNAIQLDDYTEPQPDLALLHPKEDEYEQQLAQPADIFLLIEISDTTLDYDREQKIPRYAAAHIPEVWIVNVNQRVIEQYTQPFEGQYTQIKKYLRGMTLQSATLPQIIFPVQRIFR